MTPPTHAALRYVALGDSYTIGTALDSATERWPEQLVERLRYVDGSPLLELVGESRRERLHVGQRDRRRAAPARPPGTPVRVAARRGQRHRPGRSGRDVRGERGGDPRHPPRHARAIPDRDGRDAGLHGHAAGRELRRPGDAVGRDPARTTGSSSASPRSGGSRTSTRSTSLFGPGPTAASSPATASTRPAPSTRSGSTGSRRSSRSCSGPERAGSQATIARRTASSACGRGPPSRPAGSPSGRRPGRCRPGRTPDAAGPPRRARPSGTCVGPARSRNR